MIITNLSLLKENKQKSFFFKFKNDESYVQCNFLVSEKKLLPVFQI